MTDAERGIEVVREPYDSPEHRAGQAIAGVGVGITEAVGHETAVTVCQLWPDNSAEPVYVEPRDVPALCRALLDAYAECDTTADATTRDAPGSYLPAETVEEADPR